MRTCLKVARRCWNRSFEGEAKGCRVRTKSFSDFCWKTVATYWNRLLKDVVKDLGRGDIVFGRCGGKLPNTSGIVLHI